MTLDVAARDRHGAHDTGAHEETHHEPEVESRTRFTSQGEIPAVQPQGTPKRSPSERAFEPTLTAEDRRYIDGVTIVAPAGTHESAVAQAGDIVRKEVGRNKVAQQKLAASRATIVIIPAHTKMTDVSEFAGLKGQKTFDGRDWSGVRGSGGMQASDGSFAIGVAEENLTQIPGVLSTYPTGYSIGMHELAHAVESHGMTKPQQDRLKQLYQQHSAKDPGDRKDTFTDTYAASNQHEYFAQATNAFFGRNQGSDAAHHANHDGRAWLQKNDPDMYAFLVEMYETDHPATAEHAP